MFIEHDQMIGQHYIDQTRAYLDYLEEHFTNIRKAFQAISEACNGMVWVGDDRTWHTLRHEVCWHDVSKFSMEEFTQYRAKFFPTGYETQDIASNFDIAWEHHYSFNEHHAEFINALSDEVITAKPGLVERYLVHMVVDWTAMGYKFGDTAQNYYEANRTKTNLLPQHEKFIYTIFERLLHVNTNQQANP